jgi:hypothetical protein
MPNHMTREKNMFTSYVKNKDSYDMIIFGDGNQGKVKGMVKIAITTEHSISNVFLVESLGYNLLAVSQCWRLVLKYYELRTRQHKILNVNALRPSKHYSPQDIMIFRRRS